MTTSTGIETFEWALSRGVTGVLSIVILGLVVVIRLLWERTNTLQADKDKLQTERLVDAAKNTEAMLGLQNKTIESVQTLGQVAEGYEAAVEQLKDLTANPNRRTKP